MPVIEANTRYVAPQYELHGPRHPWAWLPTEAALNHFGWREKMRAVVQRVSRAQVSVAGETVGSMERGFLVLLGVAVGDTSEDVQFLAQKIVALRVFDDDQGKMNLSLGQVGGKMLAVSQFTLLGDCRKGRRPSFDSAARPEVARELFEEFVAAVCSLGIETATGRFQEHMLVELTNDGPVTLLLDSRREF